MWNKVKYKAKFLDEWLENFDFKDWMQRHQKHPTCAFCKYCHKTFSVTGQGVKQLYSYIMNSDKQKTITCRRTPFFFINNPFLAVAP